LQARVGIVVRPSAAGRQRVGRVLAVRKEGCRRWRRWRKMKGVT
jgi:hypothetical protein